MAVTCYSGFVPVWPALLVASDRSAEGREHRHRQPHRRKNGIPPWWLKLRLFPDMFTLDVSAASRTHSSGAAGSRCRSVPSFPTRKPLRRNPARIDKTDRRLLRGWRADSDRHGKKINRQYGSRWAGQPRRVQVQN